ncbi:hypothetical protein H5410_014458 [Solanum commersonii]|uniref:Uncharacterized protein n=1 Tax=Solanum commersonii TaxID=4109 RepID=A0A9J5ZRF6_SOLCO|nr:hypothetical protein H5410_014458 [Solanum commersonii]
MKTSSKKFTVGSAWEEIRQKGHKKEEYVFIWNTRTQKINLVSKCKCCEKVQRKIIDHLFINGEFTESIWKYYADVIGLLDHFIQVHQAIQKWWDIRHCAKLTILQVVHAYICWQL